MRTYYTPLIGSFYPLSGKVTDNYFKITESGWFTSKFVTVTHLTEGNPNNKNHFGKDIFSGGILQS